MNSPKNYTLATAPRDMAELSDIGHFVHKRLANDLKAAGIQVFKNDDEAMAFLSTSSKARAEILLSAFQLYDAQNGRTMTRQPVTNGQTPAAEQAQTAAHTPAAAAAVARRSPVTAGGAASSYGLGGQQVATGATTQAGPQAGTQRAATGASPELLELLTTIRVIATRQQLNEELLNNVNDKVESILQALDLQTQVAAKQSTLLTSSMQIQNVMLGVLTILGEQILNCPKDAFLSEALTSANESLSLLEQVREDTEGKEG